MFRNVTNTIYLRIISIYCRKEETLVYEKIIFVIHGNSLLGGCAKNV